MTFIGGIAERTPMLSIKSKRFNLPKIDMEKIEVKLLTRMIRHH